MKKTVLSPTPENTSRIIKHSDFNPLTMNIGVFGLSANPPTLAHAALLLVAQKQLNWDRVFIIPNRLSPLKSESAPVAHRLNMLHLLIRDFKNEQGETLSPAHYVIDPMEINRKTPSYMVHTLIILKNRLMRQYPQHRIKLTLIMGQDSFQTLNQWHQWEKIIQLCDIAVVRRGNSHAVMEQSTNRVCFINTPGWQISSTAVRDAIKHGLSTEGLTTPSIRKYCDEHHLYL